MSKYEQNMTMAKPLIILTGPTAVGKSALSVALAKEIGGEIISADSMQVYRHMDIGSAKITRDEMQGIPHYLIDILEPVEEFHVVRFQSLAREALRTIYAKGRIPILAGGTGFYIQSVLYDIDFTETENRGMKPCLKDSAASTRNPARFFTPTTSNGWSEPLNFMKKRENPFRNITKNSRKKPLPITFFILC